MTASLSPMVTGAILGMRTRDAAILLVVVAVVVVLGVLVARRGRRPRLQLRELSAEDVERYLAAFAAVEREFIDQPAQSAARARGLVEEVMRRRGFPDRIEPAQRITDLRRHDKEAAGALQTANTHLAGDAADTEKLRQVVQGYRTVLLRLTGSTSTGPT